MPTPNERKVLNFLEEKFPVCIFFNMLLCHFKDDGFVECLTYFSGGKIYVSFPVLTETSYGPGPVFLTTDRCTADKERDSGKDY